MFICIFFLYEYICVCIHVQKCKPPISHIWELLIFGICLFLMFLCRFHGNLFVSSSQRLLIWGGGYLIFMLCVGVCHVFYLGRQCLSLPIRGAFPSSPAWGCGSGGRTGQRAYMEGLSGGRQPMKCYLRPWPVTACCLLGIEPN